MDESSSAHSKIVVVVLNWNNWEDTILSAESVLRSDYPNFQLVIVDNDSTDGSPKRVKEWAEGKLKATVDPDDTLNYLYDPPVEKPVPYAEYDRGGAENSEADMPEAPLVLIQTGENLGYAGGNNVAIKFVQRRESDSYILILNNDAAVTPGFLASAMDLLAGGEGAGLSVLGFVAHWYHEPERVATAYMREEFTKGPMFVTEPPKGGGRLKRGVMVYGGAMLITPESPVKLLPEEYFMYCEDMDYCKQVFAKGGEIAAQLDNPVYERGGSSIGSNSPAQIYYTRRNKLAFSKRHYSKLEYTLILARMAYSTVAGCARSILRGDREMVKAHLLAYLHHLQGKMGRTWMPGR
ncbi:MAG: glycosyltransferase family 2 protein [Rubrobacter sp.]|nr:glycosyltransferase family 2 protein [Rubrobacter sp.]